jgi:uncharacterized protein (TIGR03435 family)
MRRTMKIVVASALLLSLTIITVAQNQPLAFEVASVKPSPPGSNGMSIGLPAGRFTARNASLKLLMVNAFDIRTFQIVGGAGWMDSDRFDIEAKTPGNISGKQGYEMLQTLLADRFQLKIHWETREMPIYTLVVEKNGPKLNPAKEDGRSMVSGRGRGRMDFQKVSLPTLAVNLAGNLDRIVIDKTGLSGEFDFTLEWNPDLSQPDPDQSKPSIFTALTEQLGLRLESTRGAVEVLVIDHAEKPSEN